MKQIGAGNKRPWPLLLSSVLRFTTASLLAVEVGAQENCDYVFRDCNRNGVPNELADVIATIGGYRGSADPAYTRDCPPNGADFAPEADVNGNCTAFELGDVVTEIAAYRGTSEASGCEDCPGN